MCISIWKGERAAVAKGLHENSLCLKAKAVPACHTEAIISTKKALCLYHSRVVQSLILSCRVPTRREMPLVKSMTISAHASKTLKVYLIFLKYFWLSIIIYLPAQVKWEISGAVKKSNHYHISNGSLLHIQLSNNCKYKVGHEIQRVSHLK